MQGHHSPALYDWLSRWRAIRHESGTAPEWRYVCAQAMGDWTAEEHELFMRTATAHGVGDKWGLFASHIPQRVGYQCSAYYRESIIPRGLVLDARFKLTRGGKAVFVG